MRQREFGHEERGANIVSERPVEILDPVGVGYGVGNEDACIVDQHVEAAKTAERKLHQGPGLPFFGQIAEIGLGLPANCNDRLGHFLHGIRRQPAEHEPRSFACKFMGNRLPYARSGTGDDRNFIFEPHRSIPSVLRKS